MNRFGTLPLPSTIHRCESALARSQYPKIDDALELLDGDNSSRALAYARPSPRMLVVDSNHDVHFALDYDNG